MQLPANKNPGTRLVPGVRQAIIGIAVNTQDDGLTIGFFRAVSIVSASASQRYPVALALDTQAVAGILYFVDPVISWIRSGQSGTKVPLVGIQNSNDLSIFSRISIRRSFANLLPRIGVQNAIQRWIMRGGQGRPLAIVRTHRGPALFAHG
jgi:hypothetical protein